MVILSAQLQGMHKMIGRTECWRASKCIRASCNTVFENSAREARELYTSSRSVCTSFCSFANIINGYLHRSVENRKPGIQYFSTKAAAFDSASLALWDSLSLSWRISSFSCVCCARRISQPMERVCCADRRWSAARDS